MNINVYRNMASSPFYLFDLFPIYFKSMFLFFQK